MASSYKHRSGFRTTDPDETEGRLLYRQLAEAQARRDLAMQRRVTLKTARGGEHG